MTTKTIGRIRLVVPPSVAYDSHEASCQIDGVAFQNPLDILWRLYDEEELDPSPQQETNHFLAAPVEVELELEVSEETEVHLEQHLYYLVHAAI